ncbi:MAG: DUF6171 family protein [Treponema sp.]|nr:DUF6171 family protein [Treponema sp.]
MVLGPEQLEVLASECPIPASLRAGESVLRRRLACCSGCGSLREKVLCAHCGCFVRLRAAVLKSRCPSPAGDKWAVLPDVPAMPEEALLCPENGA